MNNICIKCFKRFDSIRLSKKYCSKQCEPKWIPTSLQKHKYHLKNAYNLSVEEYNRLVKQQNERCIICLNKTKLYVDHCHVTKKIRGLLCLKCNAGIGSLNDSIANLHRAITYLGATSCQNSINIINSNVNSKSLDNHMIS